MPKREPISLAPVLNRIGAIRLLQRFRKQDRRLVHAGPGLRVQAFDRYTERGHFAGQRFEEGPVLVGAEQRITEHAGRQGRRRDALLVGPGLRGFAEVEPFEFHSAHRHDAQLFGALQHALQHLPRADGERGFLAAFLDDEIREEERHITVPGDPAQGANVDPCEHVGKALVPARVRRVVVGDVHHVPAEHDVAKAESAFDGRVELLLVQVLSPQHAVDVGDGDLDAGPGRLLDGGDGLGDRNGSRHRGPPGVLVLWCGKRRF